MDQPFRKYICQACGWIYDESVGDPDGGLAAGTRYEDIPDDWFCPLCGLGKGDLTLMSDAPRPVTPPPVPRRKAVGGGKGSEQHLVILGAGIAGWSVAEAVRRRDPERPILLVSACEGLVYPKPALSTALAQGRSAEALVEATAEARAASLNIEVRTGVRALRIDTARQRVVTARGGIAYGDLVLALGAQQRRLDLGGDAAGEVLRVNDLASYRDLRGRLSGGVGHVTIIGAGLIGCEFAEDLRAGGYQVTLVDPAPGPLSGMLPESLSERLGEALTGRGVQQRYGVTVDAVERSSAGYRVTLADGNALDTDLVLSAAGLVANTELAAKSGISCGRGIATDAEMETSVPHVYAVGDCAEVEGEIYAYIEPIRRQAEAVAARLAGASAPFESRPPLVRVKTPSLPLCICLPARAASGEWRSVGGDGTRLEYRVAGRTEGFALAGAATRQAPILYRELEAGHAPNEAA